MNNLFLSSFKIRLNLIYLFIIASLIFIIATISIFSNHNYLGFDGPDQFHIERIAEAIINKNSLKGIWSHGLGYPILVAPFTLYEKLNPLNAVNFFLFVTSFVVSGNAIFQIIKEKRKQIYFIIILSISFIFSPDIYFWVLGGSNALSATLLIVSFSWALVSHPPKLMPIYLAFLSGLVFSSRYIDFFLLSPIIYAAYNNYYFVYKTRIFNLLSTFIVIFGSFLFLTLFLHYFFLGHIFSTPYDHKLPNIARLEFPNQYSVGEGISGQFTYRYFEWILPNLYSTIIDPRPFASLDSIGWGKSALYFTPFYFLFPYSFAKITFHLCKLSNFLVNQKYNFYRVKITLFSFCISLVFYSIFYASSWPYTAHDLKYLCLRYFMGWFTIILFFTIYGIFLENSIKSIFLSIVFYSMLFTFPDFYKYITDYSGYQVKKIEYQIPFKSIQKYDLPYSLNNLNQAILLLGNNGIGLSFNKFDRRISILSCKDYPSSNFQINQLSNKCKFFPLQNRKGEHLLYEPEKGMVLDNIIKNKNNNYFINFYFLRDINNIQNFPFSGNKKLNKILSQDLIFENDYINPLNFTHSVLPFEAVEGSTMRIYIPNTFSNHKQLFLSFDLMNSQDNYFPDKVSLSCLDNELDLINCYPSKIGRLNNRWSLKIKRTKGSKYIDINIDSLETDSPQYFSLQSLSIR
tara:strand:- start:803 stop:2860 length:2058 start_codon:yes stop_codon:yes gene_type:complete